MNHFPLLPGSRKTLLFAGGIGVTPLIAMAHALHRQGADFALHYSAASKANAGFIQELRTSGWASRVHTYFKDEAQRADLESLIPEWHSGMQLYTCGSPR